MHRAQPKIYWVGKRVSKKPICFTDASSNLVWDIFVMQDHKMTFYILKEIIQNYSYEPDTINILEISQDKEFLLKLKNQYEEEFKLVNQRISRAAEVFNFITRKIVMEYPDPELNEQEDLKGKVPTYEQQKLRSKIGNENAVKIRKIEKLRSDLKNEEISKLSEYDKESLKYFGKYFSPTEYIVEEFESEKPQFKL